MPELSVELAHPRPAGPHVAAGVEAAITKRLLYPQQLVVFGNPITPGSRPGFDLSGREPNCQISNRSIFGFTATMAGN